MRPVKRSFSIDGHRTSISLEAAFWSALKDVAQQRHVSIAALVREIDQGRGGAGLSSAVRVYLLHHFRERQEDTASVSVNRVSNQSTRQPK